MSTYIDSQWYPSVSRRFSLSGSPAAPSVIQHLGGQTCAVVLSFKMLQGFPRYSEHFRANDFPLHGQPRLTDSMSSLFHSFGMLSRPAQQQCNMQTSQCTTWERCSSPIPLPAAVRLFVNLHYSCLWWNQTRAVAWMCPYVALECIGTHSKSFNISRTVHECHCMSAVFSLFVAPALRAFLQDTPSPSGYCEVASHLRLHLPSKECDFHAESIWKSLTKESSLEDSQTGLLHAPPGLHQLSRTGQRCDHAPCALVCHRS